MKEELKVNVISLEEMLKRTEQDYNPSTWKERVMDYMKYKKCQFYVIEKGIGGYDYSRFFVSYLLPNGMYVFNQFNAFHSSLTNNGFCKVVVTNTGLVYKTLFKDSTGKEGYAENTKQNRDSMIKNVCSLGIMVSTCL